MCMNLYSFIGQTICRELTPTSIPWTNRSVLPSGRFKSIASRRTSSRGQWLCTYTLHKDIICFINDDHRCMLIIYKIYVQVQPTAVIIEQHMLYEFSFIDSSMTGLGPRTIGQHARDHVHFGCQCQRGTGEW